MVGSPNNAGYFTKTGSTITGIKAGAAVDPLNPVVTNTAGRKVMYRVSGDKGEAFGVDRGLAVAQWYMGPRKWLDINRGKGTDPNGNGAIDIPLFRLSETYLIRAEILGRLGNFTLTIPTAEKVAPYSVVTDSYSKIAVDGTEWQGGTAKAKLENYPPTAVSDLNRFVHFIYNERARELIFEETCWEDLHNAGILYDRIFYHDQEMQ